MRGPLAPCRTHRRTPWLVVANEVTLVYPSLECVEHLQRVPHGRAHPVGKVRRGHRGKFSNGTYPDQSQIDSFGFLKVTDFLFLKTNANRCQATNQSINGIVYIINNWHSTLFINTVKLNVYISIIILDMEQALLVSCGNFWFLILVVGVGVRDRNLV